MRNRAVPLPSERLSGNIKTRWRNRAASRILRRMPNLAPDNRDDGRTGLNSLVVAGNEADVKRVPSPTRIRYDYMDSLRATLIIAGVFFHAALPYRVSGHWNVQEAAGAVGFDYLTVTLSYFRMATFFMVAGFFCAMTFSIRTASSNLRRRLTVFSVPLLTFVVAIQPIQFALRWSQENFVKGGSPVGSSEFWRAYLSTGAFISHLWFLVNLIVYYVLVRGAMEFFGRHPAVQDRLLRLLRALPISLLRSKTALSIVCLVLVTPWLQVTSKWIPPVPGVDISELLAYLPYFLAGSLFFHSPAALEEFCVVRLMDFVVLLSAVGILNSNWANGRDPFGVQALVQC